MNKINQKHIIILVIVCILCAGILGGYLLKKSFSDIKSLDESLPTATTTAPINNDISTTTPKAPVPSPHQEKDITSGVQGTVTLGPITPVCKPTAPCEKPYATTLYIYSVNKVNNTDKLVKTISSDTNGLFETPLVPGSYYITNADPTKGACSYGTCYPIIREPSDFVVTSNIITNIKVYLDTGIR